MFWASTRILLHQINHHHVPFLVMQLIMLLSTSTSVQQLTISCHSSPRIQHCLPLSSFIANTLNPPIKILFHQINHHHVPFLATQAIIILSSPSVQPAADYFMPHFSTHPAFSLSLSLSSFVANTLNLPGQQTFSESSFTVLTPQKWRLLCLN